MKRIIIALVFIIPFVAKAQTIIPLNVPKVSIYHDTTMIGDFTYASPGKIDTSRRAKKVATKWYVDSLRALGGVGTDTSDIAGYGLKITRSGSPAKRIFSIDTSITTDNVFFASLGGASGTANDVYSVPGGGGTPTMYTISAIANVSSVSGGSVTVTVTVISFGVVSRTKTFYSQGSTTAALSALGESSFPPMAVYANASTNITVTYTVTGSIVYDHATTINRTH